MSCLVEAGMHHKTMRSHTLKAGEQLLDAASNVRPANDARAITVTIDSIFVRGCHYCDLVETAERRRQVFGAVAGTDTE